MSNLIGKLILKGTADKIEKFVTAWIFTDDGHLLTAGHGFDELESNVGDRFEILFPDSEVFPVILREFQYDIDSALDYGIAQIITTDRFERFDFTGIDHYKYNSNGEKFELQGYRDFRPEKSTSVIGEFLRPIKEEHGRWAHMYLENKQKLAGMSGGAVSNRRSEKAVAIQAQQSALGHKLDSLATIITDIPSDLTKQAFFTGYLFKSKVAYFNPKLNDLNGIDMVKRISFVIQDFQALDAGSRSIAETHISVDEQERFVEGLDLLLSRMRKYFIGILPVVRWNMTRRSVDHARDAAKPVVNELVKTYKEAEIRIVTDLSSKFIDGHDLTFASLSDSNSHVVGITAATADHNSIEILSDDKFEVVFKIHYKDHKFAERTLLNIIADVSLDISLFYSNYFQTHRYQTIAERKQFSLLKTNFAEQNAKVLRLYGRPVPTGLKYVSFASLVRSKPDSIITDFDVQKYVAIWEEFFLENRNGTEADVKGEITTAPDSGDLLTLTGDAISTDELLKRIKRQRKLGKQLSERNLKLKVHGLSKDTDYIFAVLVKKPQSRHQEEMIRATFGGKSYKLYMWAFLPYSVAVGIKKCIHLFKLYNIKVN